MFCKGCCKSNIFFFFSNIVRFTKHCWFVQVGSVSSFCWDISNRLNFCSWVSEKFRKSKSAYQVSIVTHAAQMATACFCWRIWKLWAMENVTPLWLTVAWRPADVKACLLQTAGLLCYSSSAGVSCFICNRQEVHLPFFFLKLFFFFFFSERCTPLHYRGYPQREITHTLLMRRCLLTRRRRHVHCSDHWGFSSH